MQLKTTREQISQIDTEMAKLFVRRMEAVREIAACKQEQGLPVEDREQEIRMIDRLSSQIEDETLRPYYVQFLQSTIDVSKRWQHHLISG